MSFWGRVVFEVEADGEVMGEEREVVVDWLMGVWDAFDGERGGRMVFSHAVRPSSVI